MITRDLPKEALNCRNVNTTVSDIVFWKRNQTLMDEWSPIIQQNFSLSDASLVNVFDISKKTEPSEEYWLYVYNVDFILMDNKIFNIDKVSFFPRALSKVSTKVF